MTWQDELRRLEDDLVNGRVSAEDYRIRRDQLLSSANASPQQADQRNSGDSTAIIPPVPAYNPGNQQQQSDPERTQAVRPGQQPAPNLFERPPQPQAYGGYQQQHADPERTQAVRPGSGAPQQQQEPQQEEPPWAGNEFPPLTAGSGEWVKQGPEVFGKEEKSSKGKIIGVIAGVVVVALLAVGAYFLFAKDSGGANPQAGGGNAKTEQPKTPAQQLGLIVPPGQAEDHSDTNNFDALKNANYLNPAEIQAYSNAAASKVGFVVGKNNDDTISIVGVQASSPNAATQSAKALNAVQLDNSMKPMASSAPKGVYVSELRNTKDRQFGIRGHYAHGTTIVRVQVAGSNYQQELDDFNKTLNAQLKALPADG